MTWKVSADPVDFDEAIAWFRKRVAMTAEERASAAAEAKRRAFWVSNVAQADIVAQVWRAVDDAVTKGTPLADFKRAVGEQLRRAWGASVNDAPWRLETIFRTNVQNAYGAGRFRQASHPDVLAERPVWMFDAILDGRETDICRACDGTKLEADAPWWATHTPPLHFNCRSSFITLSEDQAGKISAKAPTVDAQAGFGRAPTDEPWRPEPNRYPEQLAFDFATKTASPPPPAPRLKFVDELDAATVGKLGAKPYGDVAAASRAVFDGKCPDEASWRKIWEPPAGYAFRFDRFTADAGTLRIDGALVANDGSEVGEVIRTFKRKGAALVVKHDYLVLRDAYQGLGIGDAVSRSALRAYRELGIERVLVDAHWAGRYTWARFGFSWTAADAPRWRDRFKRFLTAKLGNAVLAAEYAELAMVGTHAVAELVVDGEKIGKEFLLDRDYVSNWEGELRLSDDDPGYKKAKERLKL